MKKLILLIVASLVLVACGSGELKGVEINDEGYIDMPVFTFDEEEFKEVYEENTGKAIPISFEINYGTMSIDNVNAEQVEGFLKSAYELLGDDIINKMYKSFKEDRAELIPEEDTTFETRGDWRKVESGDRLFLDYGIIDDETYMSSIHLYTEEE